MVDTELGCSTGVMHIHPKGHWHVPWVITVCIIIIIVVGKPY